MRTSTDPMLSEEHAALVREVAQTAEFAHTLCAHTLEALEDYVEATRSYARAVQAGREADPIPMLTSFGAARRLLRILEDRFESGGDALLELPFTLRLDEPEPIQEAPGLRLAQGGKSAESMLRRSRIAGATSGPHQLP